MRSIGTFKPENLVVYCSDTDFDYSIAIDERCKVKLDSVIWKVGTIAKVDTDSFVLREDNGSQLTIYLCEVHDIHCEEEIGTINKLN